MPSNMRSRNLLKRCGLPLLMALACAPTTGGAANVTACTTIAMCYCVNPDFAQAVDEKVTYFRKQIADQRANGKAIGYLSIPLSTAGGGYFGVNREVAATVKERIETRFGTASAFVLNPTAKDADLPTINGVRAGQGDYLLLWTRVLEGPNGLGEDFDFVYFVGPSDFAQFFHLT